MLLSSPLFALSPSYFNSGSLFDVYHKKHNIYYFCHRIMVLESGEVKELASPTELLSNKQGIFYGLAKAAGVVIAD